MPVVLQVRFAIEVKLFLAQIRRLAFQVRQTLVNVR